MCKNTREKCRYDVYKEYLLVLKDQLYQQYQACILQCRVINHKFVRDRVKYSIHEYDNFFIILSIENSSTKNKVWIDLTLYETYKAICHIKKTIYIQLCHFVVHFSKTKI